MTWSRASPRLCDFAGSAVLRLQPALGEVEASLPRQPKHAETAAYHSTAQNLLKTSVNTPFTHDSV